MTALSGKVILVTGAARGIGAAITLACRDAGAQVVPLDRDEMPGGIVADLAATDFDEIVAQVVDAEGKLDCLANAAGLTTRASFLDADVARFDSLMAVNLRAPFFLMSAAIKHLRARQAAGAIVNIQSMNAHCGAPDLAIYSASKAALQTLTKNAAQAHMADEIRVNGINLGWVDTETERALHGDLAMERAAATLPLKRFVTARECAAQVVWMLSDASRPMTGVSLDLEQWVTGAAP